MFNLVNTIICTEEPFGEGSYHMGTSRWICLQNVWLVSAWRWLLLEGTFVQSTFSLFLSVKLLSAMVIVVLRKSLPLDYCYYVVCN